MGRSPRRTRYLENNPIRRATQAGTWPRAMPGVQETWHYPPIPARSNPPVIPYTKVCGFFNIKNKNLLSEIFVQVSYRIIIPTAIPDFRLQITHRSSMNRFLFTFSRFVIFARKSKISLRNIILQETLPRARIGLATQGFSVLRSTTELPRHW